MTAQAGTYKIEEFLGEGLNSCVYRAFKESEQLGLRFEVALKILKSEKMVSVWRNEFQRLSKINSEYCVKLLGWEILSTGPALVLEHVKGLNLFELQKNCVLSAADVSEIIRQSRLGLEHLAAQGLFHGDLSPQNIMINESGHVKLVDFGISVDRKNSFVTPRYASPSVIMGLLPTLKTDLESLELIRNDIARRIKDDDDEINPISLGQKVKDALECRRKTQSRTQPFAMLARESLRKIKSNYLSAYLRSAIVAGLLLTSFFSRGDANRSSQSPLARLIIHSPNWLSVRLEGQNLGFAPLDIPLKVGKKLRLHWQATKKSGEMLIIARPGQIIRIDEKYFAENDDIQKK
jgi:serine/threonine protein kinase